MQFPNDNRVILAIGAGVAVLAAAGLALTFGGGGEGPPASADAGDERDGLRVDLADAPSLEPSRELRCFVDGQFVGMATLSNCAQRNGLATDALDVGLDAQGNLSAAPTASLAPPPALPEIETADLNNGIDPNTTPPQSPQAQPQPQPRVERTSGSACLRFNGSDWRQVSGDMSLGQCVQTLYAGTCVRPGDALYGRHGSLTLRLVPRRVEQSNDNARFRILADQDRNCQFPSLNG